MGKELMDNLELVKVDYQQFKKVYLRYRNDFPAIERRSYSLIISMLKKHISELLFLYSNHKVIGYAIVNVTNKVDYIILDYFAIKKEYRSKGYGTIFIKQLINMYSDKKGILGEVELVEDGFSDNEKNRRQRRINFYNRLGFKIIENIKITLWSVNYHSLIYPINNEIPSDKEIISILNILYKEVYNNGFNSTTNFTEKVKINLKN